MTQPFDLVSGAPSTPDLLVFKERSVLVKRLLKMLPGFSYKTLQERNLVSDFVSSIGDGGIILNVGSGYHAYEGVINLDFDLYKDVDITGDAMQLPIQTESLDGLVIVGVLEHVKFPDQAINECYRVLKPGGRIHIEVPFMQAYHASPHDYQRYTISGIRVLARRFHCDDSGVVIGPGSAYAWISHLFWALLFSFGNPALFRISRLFFRFLTFPLKYFDILLAHSQFAHYLASGFFFQGRKPVQNNET